MVSSIKLKICSKSCKKSYNRFMVVKCLFIWFKIVLLKLKSSLPVLRSINKSRTKNLTGNASERKKKAWKYNFFVRNIEEVVTVNCSLNHGWGEWRSYATFVTFSEPIGRMVRVRDLCHARARGSRFRLKHFFFRARYGEWQTKMPHMNILVLRIVHDCCGCNWTPVPWKLPTPKKLVFNISCMEILLQKRHPHTNQLKS